MGMRGLDGSTDRDGSHETLTGQHLAAFRIAWMRPFAHQQATRMHTGMHALMHSHIAETVGSHLDDHDVHLIDVQGLGDLLPAEADLGLVPRPRVGVQPVAGAAFGSQDFQRP